MDNTNIERIIAKIDNDFNPDNSDWIPRVGAWTIDAMSMLKVLRKEKKRRKVIVKEGIAISPCPINKEDITVYDDNGCKLEEANKSNGGCGCFSTGEQMKAPTSSITVTADTVTYDINNNAKYVPDKTVFQPINGTFPIRYNVYNIDGGDKNQCRNYVVVGCDKIELNFDASYIYIESDEVTTQYSNVYGCELPVIPNNGILIEAIVAWNMYKMLCRGYKHTVLNLRDNSPATNPYVAWLELKDRAKTSIINSEQGDNVEAGMSWQSAFYTYTFDPERKK